MSSIKIIKGLPISIRVGVSNNDVPVDITNLSAWETTIELRYQTAAGTKPFDLTMEPVSGAYLISMTSDQTNELNHVGSGYVIVIRASSLDGTVNLRNVIQVSVTNDI